MSSATARSTASLFPGLTFGESRRPSETRGTSETMDLDTGPLGDVQDRRPPALALARRRQ
ncbi:hypothetical protein [Streptomyces sp. NPDC048825]|uniref:hypothetical protein n=1 Tax=Streptomyces sp. NPDC048825 TaxID=3365592 RepID=UPI003720E5DC